MVDAKVEQKFADMLTRMGMHMPNDVMIDNVPSFERRSSCQSVQLDKLQSTTGTKEMDPYDDLQKPIKCRLAVNLNGKTVIVCHGTIHPASKAGDHCQYILPDHVKVGIDEVDPIDEQIPLPVPTKYFTMIGEAFGSFAQWPKNLVLLGDNDTVAPTVGKDKVETCVAKVLNNNEDVMSTTTYDESIKCNTIVDEEILKTLTNKCRHFHDSIVQMSPNGDPVNAFQVNKGLFLCDEDFKIHITVEDVIQFLNTTWLDVSGLQIYIMWLDRMHNDLEVETIGFMCPIKLSQVSKHPDAANLYIMKAWLASQFRSLLLAPHYEGKHCLLLVFHMEKNEVYVFDPQAERKRRLEIKPEVNILYGIWR